MGGFFMRKPPGGGVGGPGQPRQPKPPVDPNNPNNTGIVIPGIVDPGTWSNSAGGPLDPNRGGGGGAAPPTIPQGPSNAPSQRQPNAGLASPGGRFAPGPPVGSQMGGMTGVRLPPGNAGSPPMPMNSGGWSEGGGVMSPPQTPPAPGVGLPPEPKPAPVPMPPAQAPPAPPAGAPTSAQTGRRRALQRMY